MRSKDIKVGDVVLRRCRMRSHDTPIVKIRHRVDSPEPGARGLWNLTTLEGVPFVDFDGEELIAGKEGEKVLVYSRCLEPDPRPTLRLVGVDEE